MGRRRSETRGTGPGRPGRPGRGSDADAGARERLLEAAAEQFAAQGFAATSLRAVAAGAGVTPAMVAYYFQDKQGLLETVLQEAFERILTSLRGALADTAPSAAQGYDGVLPRFVAAYLEALSQHPWIARIVVQEVISRDTPLRAWFVDRFARRAFDLVGPMLGAEVERGRLRRDLDTRYVVLSVLGMCLFPFIAEPVLGGLLDYRIDAAFTHDFVPHTVALLQHGLGDAR